MGGPVGTGYWRAIHRRRKGDGLIERLTSRSQPGDRVYFDPGPGVRVSGVLKEWQDGEAVIEVDMDDRGMPSNAKHKQFGPVQNIMRVPVKE